MADDPRFVTSAERIRRREETVAEVARIMATNTREEWMSIFKGPGIPCSPVHSLGELVNHPHTMASDMLLTYNNDAGRELNGVAAPLRINGERIPLRCKPPRLGQHSLEVLSESRPAYGAKELNALLSQGAVFAAHDAEQAAVAP